MRLPFKEWLKKVDAILIAKVGMGIDDGEDWPSRDSWELNYTPLQGALTWASSQDGFEKELRRALKGK